MKTSKQSITVSFKAYQSLMQLVFVEIDVPLDIGIIGYGLDSQLLGKVVQTN